MKPCLANKLFFFILIAYINACTLISDKRVSHRDPSGVNDYFTLGEITYREIDNIAFAPVYTIIDIFNEEELDAKDYNYLAGYVALSYSLNRIDKVFFTIDIDDVQEQFEKEFKKESHAKVLYIDSTGKRMSSDDSRVEYLEFLRRYGDHPNAHYVKADTIEELAEQLANVERHGPFDRIDFLVHGHAGNIVINKQEINAKSISKLKKALDSLDLAEQNAEFKLFSCASAVNHWFGRSGDNILRETASIFLKKGGTAIGSTKVIAALPAKYTENQSTVRKGLLIKETLTHAMGLGVVRHWNMLWQIPNNNLIDAIKTIKKIRVNNSATRSCHQDLARLISK